MKVRVDGVGLVEVSDRHKKRLDKLKRGWGAEAIYFKMSNDHKAVHVNCIYTGIEPRIIMPVIKG